MKEAEVAMSIRRLVYDHMDTVVVDIHGVIVINIHGYTAVVHLRLIFHDARRLTRFPSCDTLIWNPSKASLVALLMITSTYVWDTLTDTCDPREFLTAFAGALNTTRHSLSGLFTRVGFAAISPWLANWDAEYISPACSDCALCALDEGP